MPIKVEHLTHHQARDLVRDGGSLVTLVEEMLGRINEAPAGDPFLESFDQEALDRAAEVTDRIRKEQAGSLAGMVVSLKDNLCYKGHAVGAASRILEGFRSIYNATVVERLLDEDAIVIGRTNCDEFAMGSSNENSSYRNVSNPYDNARVPGGSSGGSAASVAAGMCHVSLGSDTGGSIRQPASFCGIVGMKPTYGRVSRYGLLAFASSFDQIGPLANSVEDAASMYAAIAGNDPRDSTSSQRKVEQMDLTPPKGLRIAYYTDCMERPGLDPVIKKRLEGLIDDLRSAGHTVEGVELPMLEEMVPAYYVLTTAEASSNLARYDGIHYGHRSADTQDVESAYTLSRTEGFGSEVKRRIMLGTFVLSAGYYDAYYSKAQKVRRLIRDQAFQVLESYDAVLSPTCPIGAFKKGALIDDPIAMYLQDIFTVQANLAGTPAISVPIGRTDEGMPFGAHLMTRSFDEVGLFRIAHYVEQHLV